MVNSLNFALEQQILLQIQELNRFYSSLMDDVLVLEWKDGALE